MRGSTFTILKPLSRGKEKEVNQVNLPEAMAFYHQAGLPATWEQAMQFAGIGGHLATLPEIVNARIVTVPGEFPWEHFFTTHSAEYYGFSKSGRRILIVAHGVGPMATLDGTLKAYSFEYKDKNKKQKGGRITEQEFWDLEAGKYGAVEIIDYDNYCNEREYPFIDFLSLSKALADPVLHARLGQNAETLIMHYAEAARAWHLSEAEKMEKNSGNLSGFAEYKEHIRQEHLAMARPGSDPFLIRIQCAANCPYPFGRNRSHWEVEKGHAVAHLLSVSRPFDSSFDGNRCLLFDVHCHEWLDGCRLVAIKQDGNITTDIHPGLIPEALFKANWRKLFSPAGEQREIGFCSLMDFDRELFTQYPKKGNGVDTWEPEYLVGYPYVLGKPILFRTEKHDHPKFLKYDINDLRAIAPRGANAYLLMPGDLLPNGAPQCLVQFFKIWADTTRRLIRVSELAHNYQTMMNLAFS